MDIENKMDSAYDSSQRARRAAQVAGRRVVVIGGGTGLSTLLLGLKEYTHNITAVVTVTDDGGSSGMLRREFGILPPGDIRNCILALGNTGGLLGPLMNHRFQSGSLKDQNFGNLLLLALNELCGSFVEAVENMSKILAITGKVIPVTEENIVLEATFDDESIVRGETTITSAKKNTQRNIRQVRLVPEKPEPLPGVLEAILEAEVIILGPGSLYTSVLPNLLVPGVAQAISESKAVKLYVMNLMTQDGETEGFSAVDHIRTLQAHTGRQVVDYCVYNTEPINRHLMKRYSEEGGRQLFPQREDFSVLGVQAFGADLLAHDGKFVRHDPLRLSYFIMNTVNEIAPRNAFSGAYDRYLLNQE